MLGANGHISVFEHQVIRLGEEFTYGNKTIILINISYSPSNNIMATKESLIFHLYIMVSGLMNM